MQTNAVLGVLRAQFASRVPDQSDSCQWRPDQMLPDHVPRAVAILCTALLVMACPPAVAQEERDFTTLDLKELLALDVITINVLGTHLHPAGQFMIGYEFMFDNMDGNRDGTSPRSHRQVLDAYNTAPTNMTM